MRVVGLRLALGKVEGTVDGRLAIKELIGLQNIPDALVSLSQ